MDLSRVFYLLTLSRKELLRQWSSAQDMSAVEGTDHTHGATPEHVCVYFCGAHIAVAKQLLDGTYVVALLQQASGKAVPERVAAYRFSDIGLAPGAPDRFSQGGVMQMVTSQLSTARVSPDTRAGNRNCQPSSLAARGYFLAKA